VVVNETVSEQDDGSSYFISRVKIVRILPILQPESNETDAIDQREHLPSAATISSDLVELV